MTSHRRKMAIYTKTAPNPKYVLYTSICNIRATRSVRMILEVLCMQFDSYAPCMCAADIQVFSRPPSFRIDRRPWKRGYGSREMAATVDRCICPGLSPTAAHLWREHTHPNSSLNFSDRTCDELSYPFFSSRNAPLALWRIRVGPIKWMTTAWTTSEIEISRTVPGYSARIIINATTYRHSGENNWIVKHDSRRPFFIPITNDEKKRHSRSEPHANHVNRAKKSRVKENKKFKCFAIHKSNPWFQELYKQLHVWKFYNLINGK